MDKELSNDRQNGVNVKDVGERTFLGQNFKRLEDWIEPIIICNVRYLSNSENLLGRASIILTVHMILLSIGQ